MVLADVVMPGMYGTQMADEIRRIDPETKILLMSGYPEREIVVGRTGYGFIEKPILAIQLLNAIELLTGPVSGRSDRGLSQTFNT